MTTFLSDVFVYSGEIPSPATVARLAPPPRRPNATGENPTYQASTIGVVDRVRPDTTARILRSEVARVVLADPKRPRRYRGAHRWDDRASRAALIAASAVAL
jgi:hypothetical protein